MSAEHVLKLRRENTEGAERPLAELHPEDPERKRRVDAEIARVIEEQRDLLVALAKR